jgi:hypothetical protein
MGGSDNDLKYRAPKGDEFARRVVVGKNDILAPPVRGDAPLNTDLHGTKLGPSIVQRRWNEISGGRGR